MIFTPKHAEDVRQGRKTRTRRLSKAGDYLDASSGTVYNLGDRRGMANQRMMRWQVGRWYAIQDGRGHRANGRFLLTAVRREPLQAITQKEAVAEACRSVEAFQDVWDALNPYDRWEDNPEVWVLTIRV